MHFDYHKLHNNQLFSIFSFLFINKHKILINTTQYVIKTQKIYKELSLYFDKMLYVLINSYQENVILISFFHIFSFRKLCYISEVKNAENCSERI